MQDLIKNGYNPYTDKSIDHQQIKIDNKFMQNQPSFVNSRKQYDKWF